YAASIEELNMHAARGIDRSLITTLATGTSIKNGDPVLISGATGCGKSSLASALRHHACTQGYRVSYSSLQKVSRRTRMGRIEGTMHNLLDRLSKTDLIILDDFGMISLDQQQRLDLMEIIEDRHGRSSTIIASQLPVANWYDVIGEDTIADAILDRLVHSSYRIELKGESLRKKK